MSESKQVSSNFLKAACYLYRFLMLCLDIFRLPILALTPQLPTCSSVHGITICGGFSGFCSLFLPVIDRNFWTPNVIGLEFCFFIGSDGGNSRQRRFVWPWKVVATPKEAVLRRSSVSSRIKLDESDWESYDLFLVDVFWFFLTYPANQDVK